MPAPPGQRQLPWRPWRLLAGTAGAAAGAYVLAAGLLQPVLRDPQGGAIVTAPPAPLLAEGGTGVPPPRGSPAAAEGGGGGPGAGQPRGAAGTQPPLDLAAGAASAAGAGEPCAEAVTHLWDAWDPGAVALAGRRLGAGGGFAQACNETLREWQRGFREAVTSGRTVAAPSGPFCQEDPPGIARTTRPDVVAFALAQRGRWRAQGRRIFVDAGGNMFARVDKRGTWYLGSTAAFVCGYPQGHSFELYAFEPNSPKYRAKSRPWSRRSNRDWVAKIAGLKWYISYPPAVHVSWVGTATKTGTMYLVGDGLHAHLVDEQEAYRNATPLETPKPRDAREAQRLKAAAAIAERWHKQKPVPMSVVSLADWLRNNTREEDFVALKIDIEGMEHQVIPQLQQTGALRLVDELFVECHHQNTGTGPGAPRASECQQLRNSMLDAGVPYHDWH
eukprot:TRINITY_DN47981_c0_g1_i1.p1 TRINITY_DN47981_c0_g1~~TRINITY_DN47981_c0_g1_i1.p1  ORF type:complete len:445 (+),score=101.46 TRINITY_DN47981_c0_g1_i1:104-1438(+)